MPEFPVNTHPKADVILAAGTRALLHWSCPLPVLASHRALFSIDQLVVGGVVGTMVPTTTNRARMIRDRRASACAVLLRLDHTCS